MAGGAVRLRRASSCSLMDCIRFSLVVVLVAMLVLFLEHGSDSGGVDPCNLVSSVVVAAPAVSDCWS